MFSSLLVQYLTISMLTGIAIVAIKFCSKRLNKAFPAEWKYWIWLALAVRLLVPVGFRLPKAPIQVMLPATVSAPGITATETAALIVGMGTNARHGFTTPSWEHWVVLLWFVGFCVILAWHLIGYHSHCKRLLRWSTPLANSDIQSLAEMERYKLGIRRRIKILRCQCVHSPTMIGFFRPQLLLPPNIGTMSSIEIVFVLRHELIHLKRHDLWYKLVLVLASAAHWFNPAAYWMLREASADLEISCDAKVLSGVPADMRHAYGETILSFISLEKHGIRLSAHFNGGAKMMKERLVNLMRTGSKRRGITTFATLLLVVAMAGSLVGATFNDAHAGLETLLTSWSEMYSDTERWNPVAYSPYAPLPDERDITQDEALRIAAQYVLRAADIPVSTLATCGPLFSFVVYENGLREWTINFLGPVEPTDQLLFTVTLDSTTGNLHTYSYGARG